VTNNVDFQPDKLGCDLGAAFRASLIPAILDCDGATLDPAEFTHSLHKGRRPWTQARCIRAQKTNGRQLARLLRARRERPCRRAEQRDERAAFHSTTCRRA
jgi:hypothetical protein